MAQETFADAFMEKDTGNYENAVKVKNILVFKVSFLLFSFKILTKLIDKEKDSSKKEYLIVLLKQRAECNLLDKKFASKFKLLYNPLIICFYLRMCGRYSTGSKCRFSN
jgi:hypothetical protein